MGNSLSSVTGYPAFIMNKNDAWVGTLVADAAALGLHWLYDQDQIQRIEASGPAVFRHPDAAHYEGMKGYFAHARRRAGQLSHYGESARLVGALAAEGKWNPAAHQQRFLQVFGPCGEFVGYADRPTKALVARILQEGDELNAVSGMDDNQLPGLAVVAGLFSASKTSDDIQAATSVISTHDDVVAGSLALFRCLSRLFEGASINEALQESAAGTKGELGARLQEALAMPDHDPLKAANHFGKACYVRDGLPVVWHLLKHASSFESVVLDNVRCGGDSCGRAMALGAIAGMLFGIPDAMMQRISPDVLYDIVRYRE